MAEYNGHRSWNAWNVALWIHNDESLYFTAVEAFKTSKTERQAQQRFRELTGIGPTDKTPDGAVYNTTSVKLALRGLELPLGRA